ncbi:MAG TPA: hypothetical protein VGM36_15575 [Rhizomicrobium sp.]|jgi:hypothetical protein
MSMKFVAVTSLCAAILSASAAQAMEIWQFDKMADQDQSEYLGLLVQGAEKVLNDEGRADLAAQVDKLFLTTLAGDKMTLGMTEFERNLAIGRAADAKRVAKDPNARRIEVEDALALTLKKNGIALPGTFFTVASGFQPKLPLQRR